MHGGHEAFEHTPVVITTLAYRARQFVVHDAIRNNGFAYRSVIDTHDEHQGYRLWREPKNNSLGSGLEVPPCFFFVKEKPGRFDNVFGADFVPLEVGGSFSR